MGNRDYISMEGNRFEVDGVRGTLRVVRHKSKNLSLFTIGVYSKEIRVELAFALPDEDAEALANWILSKIDKTPEK